MALVWKHYPEGGAEMLAMLALADYSNDEGGSIYPSMATIAKKLRVNPRQAKRIVQKLLARGFLIPDAGDSPHGGRPDSTDSTRHLRIDIQQLKRAPVMHDPMNKRGGVNDTGVICDTGVIEGKEGCHLGANRGGVNDTQNTSEPSVKQTSVNPEPKKPARFDPLSLILPVGMSAKAWADWIAYRRTRKLTCAEPTMHSQIANLAAWHAAGHNPDQIIADSIANGWQGLFEPKARGPTGSGGTNRFEEIEQSSMFLTGRGKTNERTAATERDITGECTVIHKP